MEIIQGSIENLEEIVKLNQKIFQGMYENPPYSLEHYKEKLSDKKPLIYLARDNKQIIGNSIAFEKSDSFYIWILGVDKKYRRQGIADNFLQNTEDFARVNGFELVTTKVYEVSNDMQKLLLKRDYKITGIDLAHSTEGNNAIGFELEI